MTRLIRKKASQAFLTREGGWTDDPRQAWQLPGNLEARAAMHELQLHDVELYYCYLEQQTSHWDFVVPLE